MIAFSKSSLARGIARMKKTWNKPKLEVLACQKPEQNAPSHSTVAPTPPIAPVPGLRPDMNRPVT